MKRLSKAILAVVLLGVLVLPVYAAPPGPNLKAVAERILSETMSEEEFKGLSLSDEEVWALIRWVIILQDYSGEEADRLIEQLKHERAASQRGGGVVPLGGPCSQAVEMEDGGNRADCDNVWVSTWCDGQPDKDYAFRFVMYWSGDPNLIRWWSDNWWIRFVFCNAWGCDNLLGFNLCNVPYKYLCLGEAGVTTAGGPSFVKARLKLRHN